MISENRAAAARGLEGSSSGFAGAWVVRYRPAVLTVGRYQIVSVVTGWFRLDGGAMFGVVPKIVWGGREDVDESNRILMTTRTLLAVDADAGRVIIVDTGCGPKWTAKDAERYAIRPDPAALPAALARFGLTEGDVTDVIVTHLHFDHNGGLTEWVDQPSGPTRLRFPAARHWLHADHWRHAHAPTPKDRASFLTEDFEALEGFDGLTLIEGDPPPPSLPNVGWLISNGHTRAQLLPRFDGEGGPLLWTGDVIPTVSHLPIPWVMAYDLYPLTTMEEKTRMLQRCRDDGLKLAFPHDRKVAGAVINWRGDKPSIAETLEL